MSHTETIAARQAGVVGTMARAQQIAARQAGVVGTMARAQQIAVRHVPATVTAVQAAAHLAELWSGSDARRTRRRTAGRVARRFVSWLAGLNHWAVRPGLDAHRDVVSITWPTPPLTSHHSPPARDAARCVTPTNGPPLLRAA